MRLAVAVETDVVAVAIDRGVTEAIAVVGVDGTAVTLGDAGDGETVGTVEFAEGVEVNTTEVDMAIAVEDAVVRAGVVGETVGIACPDASRPVRVPSSTAVTTKVSTTKRRTARTIRRPMGAPPS